MAANPAQIFQGPSFIGLTVNIFLHGLATTQVYLYLTRYTNVTIVYLLDTFHCVIVIYYIYNSLVTHFGDEANLMRGSWGQSMNFNQSKTNLTFLGSARGCSTKTFAMTAAATTGAVSVAVQHFFTWRVYVLTKNVFVVAAIVLYSLANLAGSLGAAISLAVNPDVFLVPDLQTEVTIWLVGAVLADTIIAVSLVWHLGRHKHLYPALTSTINRILRMTVQTGLLTTIVAIINLASYLANSMGTMMLSKLYTNCMLSTLNARGACKYDESSQDEESHDKSNHPGVIAFQAQRTQPEVFVQVEPHQVTDMDDRSTQNMHTSKPYIKLIALCPTTEMQISCPLRTAVIAGVVELVQMDSRVVLPWECWRAVLH
ncbi:hypothetical protein EDC04DRAFT_2601004 [Pisolithus marmoratus]|nr:hypothetical protein EDC04DRAFT_2601004 [Pisolithus marmoratus]